MVRSARRHRSRLSAAEARGRSLRDGCLMVLARGDCCSVAATSRLVLPSAAHCEVTVVNGLWTQGRRTLRSSQTLPPRCCARAVIVLGGFNQCCRSATPLQGRRG